MRSRWLICVLLCPAVLGKQIVSTVRSVCCNLRWKELTQSVVFQFIYMYVPMLCWKWILSKDEDDRQPQHSNREVWSYTSQDDCTLCMCNLNVHLGPEMKQQEVSHGASRLQWFHWKESLMRIQDFHPSGCTVMAKIYSVVVVTPSPAVNKMCSLGHH